jgi:integrase
LTIYRRLGGSDSTGINGSELDAWRQRADKGGLSPRTIESVVSSVRTLCRVAGNDIPIGAKLRAVRRVKPTPTFAEFSRVIDAAAWRSGHNAEWWQRWLCWAYCTGLRRADLLHLRSESIRGDVMILEAGKTGKQQVIPLPARLPRGFGRFLHVGVKQLRFALRVFCGRAGVAPFTPQGIRRLAAKEWERSHAGCGAVILGHAVPGWSNATASYLDGSDLLRLGLPRLRLPAMIADPEREQRTTEIVSLATSLPDADQSAAVSVLRAMAR